MPLPRVLAAAELPVAELSAARLDGELWPLAGAAVPIDVAPRAPDRAAAALAGCPAEWIAERATALWVWGALDRDPGLEVCIRISSRSRAAAHLGAREVEIRDDELALLGGRRVTTPLRTLLDVARHDEWTAERRAACRRLARASGVDAAAIDAALPPGRRLAYATRARARLLALVSRC